MHNLMQTDKKHKYYYSNYLKFLIDTNMQKDLDVFLYLIFKVPKCLGWYFFHHL
jgi:hypothetical protein